MNKQTHAPRPRHLRENVPARAVAVSDHAVKEAAAAFLHEHLGLTLHPRKVQVMPIASGVDFLGYRIYPHYRLLRKSTVMRFVARIKREELRGGGRIKGFYPFLARVRAGREFPRTFALVGPALV